MIFRLLVSLMVCVGLAACSAPTPDVDATYYLVRHAEKLKDQDDPGLTEAGRVRAEALSELLINKGVTKIYSSDYKRTRDTAQPLADDLGLEVIIYDPRNLPGMAAQLLSETGVILVVGHSNTTPQLAELMGVAPGEPIVEATEYDRLYVIKRTGDGVSGEIIRYGD